MRQRAAALTPHSGGAQRRDADAVEHARGCRVDVRRERRLHAAFRRSASCACGAARATCRRDAPAECVAPAAPGRKPRASRPAVSAAPNSGRASRPRRSAVRRAASSGGRRTCRSTILPADVHEMPVAHARGTRRLAAETGEAAVEMQLRASRSARRALEHLLDEIDAAARTVELVAEELVGRTRRGAEAAVHARAQDRVGLAAFGRVADERGEIASPR